MDKLIEKIQDYFGDIWQSSSGNVFMHLWIQGRYENQRYEKKTIYLDLAKYLEQDDNEFYKYLSTL